MPTNKNQHFVPKCHLKPFSLDREGLAINLFNHSKGFVRENVAVSGQCSKSYFYGKDLIIEKHLQQLESLYAKCVRAVENGDTLTDNQLIFLKNFVFLQWCRTEAAIRRRRDAITAMDQLAHSGLEHLRSSEADLSQLSMIMGSLSVWHKGLDSIADLSTVILKNLTRVDFVTSDDPAILTNRVYLQRMRDTNFGLISSGLMFFMPLGPKYAILSYDDDAYAPKNKKGYMVDVRKDQDARAINQLQYINSDSNIYFAGPIGKAIHVQNDYQNSAYLRPDKKFRTWLGISEGIQGDYECFRRLKDEEDFDPSTPRITSFSPIYPSPSQWLSVFPLRSKVYGWLKAGTVIGPIRTAAAQRRPGLRRAQIGIGPLPNRNGNLPERMYQLLDPDEVRAGGKARDRRHTSDGQTITSSPTSSVQDGDP